MIGYASTVNAVFCKAVGSFLIGEDEVFYLLDFGIFLGNVWPFSDTTYTFFQKLNFKLKFLGAITRNFPLGSRGLARCTTANPQLLRDA